MKVKYKNGEVSSVRNDLGRELVRAGIAEAVDPKDLEQSNKPNDGTNLDLQPLPKPGDFRCPNPEWEVVLRKKATGGDELAIRMRILGTDYFYCGHPATANNKISWDGGFRWTSGLGREIPSETLREYEHRWKRHENLRAPASVQMDEHNMMAYSAFMQAK